MLKCVHMRKWTRFLAVIPVVFIETVAPRLVSAEEPIAIQQILDEPRVYHLRRVTMHGTARDVQPLAPYTVP